MAITNILIQSNCDLIFTRKVNLLQVIVDNSGFDNDSQMNLRFLYLLYLSLDKNGRTDIIPHNYLSPIINALLGNIHKFRNILDSKESYYFRVPSFKNSAQASNQEEKKTEQLETEESKTDKVGSNTSNGVTIKDFFFEDSEFTLRKIDAIRLSLCMSIKILYKITKVKKRNACSLIMDNDLSSELFKFFTPYLDHGDRTCFSQIKQAIKIICNCSEGPTLHT